MLLLATLHRLYCQILCLGPTDSVREGRGALLDAIKKGRALKKVELPTSKKGTIEPAICIRTYTVWLRTYVRMYVLLLVYVHMYIACINVLLLYIPYLYKILRNIIFAVFVVSMYSMKFQSLKFHCCTFLVQLIATVSKCSMSTCDDGKILYTQNN